MAQVANVTGMFFLLGSIWALAFHVANGAWSGSLLWKKFSTPQSKQLWRFTCIIFGIVLAGVGSLAWYWFTLAPTAHLVLAGKL